MPKPGINPIGPGTRMGQAAMLIPVTNEIVGYFTEKNPDGIARWVIWAGAFASWITAQVYRLLQTKWGIKVSTPPTGAVTVTNIGAGTVAAEIPTAEFETHGADLGDGSPVGLDGLPTQHPVPPVPDDEVA